MVVTCEVWSTTQVQRGRLETFHHYCLRRILRVRWFHRVRNEEVLNRASELPIKQIIGSKRLRWFGHVSRMADDRLPYYLLDWKPKHRKRSRLEVDQGKISMMFTLKMLWNRTGITVDNMKGIHADRKRWRYLTHSSCIIREDDTVDAD
jgi:hypothetical protein